MNFLIEDTTFSLVKIDGLIAIDRIKKRNDCTYKKMRYKDFFYYDNNEVKCYNKNHFPDFYQDSIPIGSVNFVQQFYKTFCGIEKENSFEIPKILRKPEYLKRYYKVDYFKNLSFNGEFFFKNASEEKTFSFLGNKKDLINASLANDISINPNHLFVCSEVVEIISEIRFYIIRGKIAQISFYCGRCDIDYDKELVKSIIKTLDENHNFPKSYSFDIMVCNKGTALLEVHSFAALGIHNYMFEESLLDGYIDSDEYYRNCNYPIEIDD